MGKGSKEEKGDSVLSRVYEIESESPVLAGGKHRAFAALEI